MIVLKLILEVLTRPSPTLRDLRLRWVYPTIATATAFMALALVLVESAHVEMTLAHTPGAYAAMGVAAVVIAGIVVGLSALAALGLKGMEMAIEAKENA